MNEGDLSYSQVVDEMINAKSHSNVPNSAQRSEVILKDCVSSEPSSPFRDENQ